MFHFFQKTPTASRYLPRSTRGRRRTVPTMLWSTWWTVSLTTHRWPWRTRNRSCDSSRSTTLISTTAISPGCSELSRILYQLNKYGAFWLLSEFLWMYANPAYVCYKVQLFCVFNICDIYWQFSSQCESYANWYNWTVVTGIWYLLLVTSIWV